MQEFLLLIRTEGNPWEVLSPEQQQKHVEKAAAYIGNLVSEGKLKARIEVRPIRMVEGINR